MKIEHISCKSALSKSNLLGLDYSLNPYKGCAHQCLYCYVPSVLRITREQWSNKILIKENIPKILSNELKKKPIGKVGISTVTDPYQPIEQKYKLTRYCLEQLLKFDVPISIQTKNKLVKRDYDIITKFSEAELMMSIATLNNEDRKLLEPYSSNIDERLKVLSDFSNSGIKTSVFFGPIYPTITIDEIPPIIEKFLDCNISEMMIDKFRLKKGIRENIISHMKKEEQLYKKFRQINDIINEHYNEIRSELIKNGKEKGILIQDAF